MKYNFTTRLCVIKSSLIENKLYLDLLVEVETALDGAVLSNRLSDGESDLGAGTCAEVRDVAEDTRDEEEALSPSDQLSKSSYKDTDIKTPFTY